MDNNLFTIILTLYDRGEYTKRWLEWMDYNKCPYKILIADGGKDEKIESYLKDTKHFPNLNYEYIRYPFDKDFPTFYDKFNDVVHRVSTPYMMLCDNDDFIILDNIAKKISFLEQNKDYSCCSGKVIHFDLLSKVHNTVTYSSTVNFLNHTFLHSIENDNEYLRIMEMLQHGYANLWYGVLRTKYAKEITSQIQDNNPLVLTTLEYYVYLMLGIFGKVKVFDDIHYVRQLYTSQAAQIPFEGDNNILIRLLSPSFQKDYAKLKHTIFQHLMKSRIKVDKEVYDKDFNVSYEKNIPIFLKQQLIKKHRNFRLLKNSILKKRHKTISKMIILFQDMTGLKITNLISQNTHKDIACNEVVNFIQLSMKDKND